MLPINCCPGKQFRPPKKRQKKNGCDWMALFELNMEFETWIAVDGHEVSQRFKIYVRGSIYLRIGTALNRNPRQAKPRWDVEQNSVTFLDTITDEDFFKGKTWHINSLSLVVTMEIRCEVFFFVVFVHFCFSFCSSFFVLNRHGWKRFFIRDIMWFSLLFFHRMDIWSLKSLAF